MKPVIRPWQSSDLQSLVKYANNPAIARFMMDKFPHPYTVETGERFISYAGNTHPVSIFAITLDDEAIGGIGLHPLQDVERQNAELGYWLAEPFWGKGIITDAIRQVVDSGFSNLAINRIFARPFGSNAASKRVLEKCGFILEAIFEKTFFKNGEYEDEYVYAIRKSG
jgi:ribosomal-protein-alanine N-acetyltransferase